VTRGRTRTGGPVPPSTAAVAYPGRTPHWIKGNKTERIPHRWIVADSESRRVPAVDGECQTLRCAAAVRWRDDLKTGDQRETGRFTEAADFWRWVTDWTYTHGRTVCWFHNASYDLGLLDAFTCLPALGYELVWCNLDRDVSVVTWRGPGGTLVIADTFTWTAQSLARLAPLTGIPKPPLPDDDDSLEAWFARCEADVAITEQVVRVLLDFIREHHLGNWQPSGAGMGHTTWRHRFYDGKVLVHDDAQALEAEREAMHAGRAEAWWHGRAPGRRFVEWDMHMAYTRIAAECLIPAKLWSYDRRPSKRVHQWSLEHFRVLARVEVTTAVPCVPARMDGRVTWPTGTFTTTLWDTELALITEEGGRYKVTEQWRYTAKPSLKAWAEWSIAMCGLETPAIHPIARTWVKHQARAVIGRMGLRTPTWEEWGRNWLPYSGISYLTDPAAGTTQRMMHVGKKVFVESARGETQQSVPQITSWVMAEARARLWRATRAAGQEQVMHVDTDSAIVTEAGDRAMTAAVAGGLAGTWRPKDSFGRLELVGPRHYFAPERRQVPGVPRGAQKQPDGSYRGELWDSLARSLTDGQLGIVRVRDRTWRPARVDYRRPWQDETAGPALPIRAGSAPQGGSDVRDRARPGDPLLVVGVSQLRPAAPEPGEHRGGSDGPHPGDRPRHDARPHHPVRPPRPDHRAPAADPGRGRPAPADRPPRGSQ
jgi:hypothetical protein